MWLRRIKTLWALAMRLHAVVHDYKVNGTRSERMVARLIQFAVLITLSACFILTITMMGYDGRNRGQR